MTNGSYVTLVGPTLYGGSELITFGALLSSAGCFIKHKFYSIVGPSYAMVTSLNDAQLPTLSKLLEEGLRPDVDQVVPLDQAKEAHQRLESHHGRGKVVLQVSQQ